MATTGGLALPTISESQAQKFQTFNDALDGLDLALTDRLAVSLAGGSTELTPLQARRCQVVALSGAGVAGRTLTLPAIKRLLLISLDGASSNSVGLVRGGTTIAVAPGQGVLVYLDGSADGIVAVGIGAIIGGTTFTLPAASDSVRGGVTIGAGLKRTGTDTLGVDTDVIATVAMLNGLLEDAELSGNPRAPTPDGSDPASVATVEYVDAKVAEAEGGGYTLPAATDSTRGGITVPAGGGLKVTGDALAVATDTIATRAYVDAAVAAGGGSGSGGASVTVSETAPAAPGAGDLWWHTALGRLFVWYGSAWVEASPGDAPVRMVAGRVGDIVLASADISDFGSAVEAKLATALPVASSSVLGGVKVGGGLAIDVAGTLSVTASGGGTTSTGTADSPPALASFAWVNQGTATAATKSYGISMKAPAVVSADSIRALVMSVPATPYSVTMRARALLPSKNFAGAGMCWRDSVSGKLQTVGAHFRNTLSGGYAMLVLNWNSPTSFNGDQLASFAYNDIPLWHRLRDDGATRYWDISADGETWITLFSAVRTTFLTPNQIGFFINPNIAANPYIDAGMTVHSWLVG